MMVMAITLMAMYSVTMWVVRAKMEYDVVTREPTATKSNIKSRCAPKTVGSKRSK